MSTSSKGAAISAQESGHLAKNFPCKAHGPTSTNLEDFEVSKDISFECRIGGPSDCLRNYRFLLAKVAYQKVALSTKEYYLLVESRDFLLNYKNFEFIKRHQSC